MNTRDDSSSRRPALIFDFGNVVAHFDYAKTCAHFGRRLGISGEAFLERVRSRGLTPLVQHYESGRMNAGAFSRAVCALAGLVLTHDEFASAWSDIFRPNEPIGRLIPILKRRGYTLVLGSNTNDLHAAQFRAQFAETLVHFDHLVLSYEIGHLKPSAPFYLACAEATGVPPESCIFIDDLVENVEGAREVGLIGLHFRDMPTLLDDLAALGVEFLDAERVQIIEGR
ncbi:MAG: HAD family phosphatase [Planctomycetaceae bacterium]|nr:HAD family phosphatase [Planctomycetaceae bacterium]